MFVSALSARLEQSKAQHVGNGLQCCRYEAGGFAEREVYAGLDDEVNCLL